MKKKRRSFEVFNLSFLDVISCAFGAIVLLLVIMKISEPSVVEDTSSALEQTTVQLQEQTRALKQESAELY
ncbi:MAG: hypothetical protein WBW79_11090, partial [Desulfocapsaceae bacterium]